MTNQTLVENYKETLNQWHETRSPDSARKLINLGLRGRLIRHDVVNLLAFLGVPEAQEFALRPPDQVCSILFENRYYVSNDTRQQLKYHLRPLKKVWLARVGLAFMDLIRDQTVSPYTETVREVLNKYSAEPYRRHKRAAVSHLNEIAPKLKWGQFRTFVNDALRCLRGYPHHIVESHGLFQHGVTLYRNADERQVQAFNETLLGFALEI